MHMHICAHVHVKSIDTLIYIYIYIYIYICIPVLFSTGHMQQYDQSDRWLWLLSPDIFHEYELAWFLAYIYIDIYTHTRIWVIFVYKTLIYSLAMITFERNKCTIVLYTTCIGIPQLS
jgi:hypothetical protein